MSEVIETYIRRHPAMPESEAFEGFLRDERISRWVGADEARRERLRAEFARVWGQVRPSATAAPARPAPALPPPSQLAPPRRLQVMCPACERLDVWSDAGVVECRACGAVYDDLLRLVPVRPVGPFAFLFGEGWTGVATAGGVALLLLGLYGVLRWA